VPPFVPPLQPEAAKYSHQACENQNDDHDDPTVMRSNPRLIRRAFVAGLVRAGRRRRGGRRARGAAATRRSRASRSDDHAAIAKVGIPGLNLLELGRRADAIADIVRDRFKLRQVSGLAET